MDKEAEELDMEITEGERLKEKSDMERKAQLWNVCIETASEALRVASHSVEIRSWRAECALAAGDVESSVGDLTISSATTFNSTANAYLPTIIFPTSCITSVYENTQAMSTLRPRFQNLSWPPPNEKRKNKSVSANHKNQI